MLHVPKLNIQTTQKVLCKQDIVYASSTGQFVHKLIHLNKQVSTNLVFHKISKPKKGKNFFKPELSHAKH